MGQFRFWTLAVNVSSEGMDRIGSNPRVEIGGSSAGDAQSRIRARRLASRNAI